MLDQPLREQADQAVRDLHELIELGLINTDAEFLSVFHYPPHQKFIPLGEEEFFRGYVRPEDTPRTIHAHLPFYDTERSCYQVPHILKASEAEKDVYLEHLAKEMDIYMARLGESRLKAHSLMLGGGKPTCLTTAQLERFLKSLASRIELGSLAQFICDIDPPSVLGDAGLERLKLLKSFGAGRLSLELQTFAGDTPGQMTRRHDGAEIAEAIERVKALGFILEIELTYGDPGEPEEQWAETVRQALRYETDELMIYRMKARRPDKREIFLQENEGQWRRKAIAFKLLEDAGYNETIERSFSKRPDYYSRYRDDGMGLQYENLSFGHWALTRLRDRASHNYRGSDLKEYYRPIQEGKLPIRFGWIETRDQHLRKNLAMPIKNRELSKEQFRKITGVPVEKIFGEKIALLKKYGLLEESGDILKASKKGRFFNDDVTQFFFHPDFIPFPRERYKAGPLNPYTKV